MCVQDISCRDTVDKLNYTAKYNSICADCAAPVEPDPIDDHYQQYGG